MEQFDEVAVGIRKQDLASAGAGDYVTAEGQPGVAEASDFGVEVLDGEVDAVAAGGGGVGGGGAGAGAGGAGQQ